MLITKLPSFRTISDDPRGALANLLLAGRGGQGYGMVERTIKNSLDSNRLSLGESDDDTKDRANYRDTDEYNELLTRITRASLVSYLDAMSKLSKKKYAIAVKGALLWLAHSQYWRLLGEGEEDDEDGNPIDPFYPKEYSELAFRLFDLVLKKDIAILNELKAAAKVAGYNNMYEILSNIGTEAFYLSASRNSRDQWNILVNRYGPIEEDMDKYGQGPSKIYREYYEKTTGISKVEYNEMLAIVTELYGEEGSITNSQLTKIINNSILPYLTDTAQTTEEVKALKSLLIHED